MRIEKPKTLAELTALLVQQPEKWRVITPLNATDDKGRYLHWDKFKRIYAKESELHWLTVKMARQSLMTHFSLNRTTFSFCVPNSLQALLHYIDKNVLDNAHLAGLNKTEQTQFLLKSLIMEEAITSAQLEGAVTTRKVAKEMLETARTPKTKDEMMIVNNYRLMQKIVALKNDELSVEMVLSLHQIATHNAIENNAVSGEFRQDDEIYIADYDGNKIHQPPTHTELNTLMENFCAFANATHNSESEPFIHPIVKAMILHFLIGYIHPFGDGNGRTARALFYWFMLKNGYWLFEYISISRLLKEAPVQYAKAYLYTETDELDITYFLYYQAEIAKRALNDLVKYLQEKQSKFREFSAAMTHFSTSVGLNYRQIQILQKAVRETGYIFTVKEISNEFGISENTARKDLNHLAELNLLGRLKTSQTMGYISPKDLLSRLHP